MKTVAVLGGGLMGSGIATALILGNYHVILKEVNAKFLEGGINRVKGKAKTLGYIVVHCYSTHFYMIFYS